MGKYTCFKMKAKTNRKMEKQKKKYKAKLALV